MLFKKKDNKPVFVCIHGFGVRKAVEFAPLTRYLNERGYEVIIPELFDINDPTDNDWTHWIARAKSALQKATVENEHVVLIGFSMGGIIASYLATIFKVDKLILMAPAYEYMNTDNVTNQVVKTFYRKPSAMPDSFVDTFRTIVDQFRDCVEKLTVDTLILHCEDDEVIHLSSSRKMVTKMTCPHLLITFEKGQHRMLDDELTSSAVIVNIFAFALGLTQLKKG